MVVNASGAYFANGTNATSDSNTKNDNTESEQAGDASAARTQTKKTGDGQSVGEQVHKSAKKLHEQVGAR